MKVPLWAEIRRLHEVERLSQAAIAATTALFPSHGPQGVGDGVAARVGARLARRHSGPLPAAD